MIVRVDWQVTGSSTIDLTDAELREAADAGVDFEEYDSIVRFFEDKYGTSELYSEIVENFDERDSPDILSAMQEGEPPLWWYDEYVEYDADGQFVGLKKAGVTDLE